MHGLVIMFANFHMNKQIIVLRNRSRSRLHSGDVDHDDSSAGAGGDDPAPHPLCRPGHLRHHPHHRTHRKRPRYRSGEHTVKFTSYGG